MMLVCYLAGEEARESVIPSLHIGSAPASEEKVNVNGSSQSRILEALSSAYSLLPPPPPTVYFTGYELPPGNPCEHFTLPPPPADKKRTGPRREFSLLCSFKKLLLDIVP